MRGHALTTHLSARLTWHDTGWDGRVCSAPLANVYCVVHDHVRDSRDDDAEVENAGAALAQIPFRPPCNRDPGVYSATGYTITHRYSLEWRNLQSVDEDLEAYTVSTSPYGHMFAEGGGWEYDADRQLEKLNEFWSAAELKKSLLFFYLKDGQPFLETSERILCGVGRLSKMGTQLYFGGVDEIGRKLPVWSRALTQNYPNEGFRLPLQEYWAAGKAVDHMLPVLPQSQTVAFSYVCEHVPDDAAVVAVERLIQATKAIQADAFVEGPWDKRLVWLEQVLGEVWTQRGPYPGIPAVLTHLGVSGGTTLLRDHLHDKTTDPWALLVSWLEGKSDAPSGHVASFLKAAPRWKGLTVGQRDLLRLLARMYMSDSQVDRVMHPLKRADCGISADDETLLANRLLSELDEGGEDEQKKVSPPVSFEAVDHAMLPGPGGGEALVDRDDDRRVRALMVETLQAAAQQGDTIMRLEDASRSSEKSLPPSDAFCRILREFWRPRTFSRLRCQSSSLVASRRQSPCASCPRMKICFVSDCRSSLRRHIHCRVLIGGRLSTTF